MKDVTFGITYWNRPDDLRRCIASVKALYPEALIDVLDTEGNLSRARNVLLRRCQTPFYFMLEEDLVLHSNVDVDQMKLILQSNPRLLGVSGVVFEENRIICPALNFVEHDGVAYMTAANELHHEPSDHFIASQVSNWGLWWAADARLYQWDERLPIGEDYDFYLRVQRAGQHRFACTRASVSNARSRPASYAGQRRLRKFYVHQSELRLGVKFERADEKNVWDVLQRTTARTRREPAVPVTDRDVTFCIPTLRRPDSLARCIQSIRNQFRFAKIDIEDTEPTGGNVSIARNALVARCATPYLFMLDDDMVLVDDEEFALLFRVLRANRHLLGVSGCMLERKRESGCAAIFRHVRRRLVELDNVHDVDLTPEGDSYIQCWYTYQFGLFRTKHLKKYAWDESIPFCEHVPFFYRLQQQRKNPMACSTYRIRHQYARPLPYRDIRQHNVAIGKKTGTFKYRRTAPWSALMDLRKSLDHVRREQKTKRRLVKHRKRLMGLLR